MRLVDGRRIAPLVAQPRPAAEGFADMRRRRADRRSIRSPTSGSNQRVVPRRLASRAAARSIATWPSWPQACMTPGAAEACGAPVCSMIGSASISARSAIDLDEEPRTRVPTHRSSRARVWRRCPFGKRAGAEVAGAVLPKGQFRMAMQVGAATGEPARRGRRKAWCSSWEPVSCRADEDRASRGAFAVMVSGRCGGQTPGRRVRDDAGSQTV